MNDLERERFVQNFIKEVESLNESVPVIQALLSCKQFQGALFHEQIHRNFQELLNQAKSKRAYFYDLAEKNSLMGQECIAKLHALTF